MAKYIRAIVLIIYSFIRFNILKIFNINNLKFSIFSIVSPFVAIEIDKKSQISLGKMIKIRSGSKLKVRKKGEIILGDNTSLNHGCMFIAHEKISVGKNVQFGPNVLIYDHDHDYRKKNGLKNLEYKTSSVEIGDNTWVGANVVILRGTKIGKNCVIAAGTILSGKDCDYYPDNSLIYQKKDTTIIEYASNI